LEDNNRYKARDAAGERPVLSTDFNKAKIIYGIG
jgi:hypothetical protein